MNPDFDEFLAFITNMVIRVVKFSSGGYNIGKILPTNQQHTQRKLLNFENWCQKLGIVLENKVI